MNRQSFEASRTKVGIEGSYLGLKSLRLTLRLAKEWLRRRSWQLLLFLDSLICMDERYGVKSLEELLPQDVLNCDRDFTSLSV
jgi:hypothetical protein